MQPSSQRFVQLAQGVIAASRHMLRAICLLMEGSDTVSESFLLVCDDVPHTVVLTDCGPRAIEIVKLLRTRTGLSLRHCKSLVSEPPATILENVPEEVATAMMAELRAAGAAAHVEAKQ
ncbi:ribosomal protein L7/L12 [Streptomyces tritici]|uniref:ribosomal protein L7/L12 n=1 Tax=Streptomyces tritici TaxID=2054410 RepID=UPI003AF1C32F